MSLTTISVAREGATLAITLRRPERLNAINGAMLAELDAEIELASQDPTLRVITLTGEGRGFCSGGDLDELPLGSPEDTYHRVSGPMAGVMRRLKSLPMPVLIGLNGVAAGGGASLALAGDLVLAARGSRLVLPWVRMGLAPDWGITHLLTEAVGPARAKQLLWSSASIDAAQMYELGIAAEVVPDGDLERVLSERAAELAAAPALPVWLTKRLIDGGSGALQRALESEAAAQAVAASALSQGYIGVRDDRRRP